MRIRISVPRGLQKKVRFSVCSVLKESLLGQFWEGEMKLVNGNFVKDFRVPNYFDKISICYDGKKVPEELKIFDLALALVAQQIETSLSAPQSLMPNVYFLESNFPTFELDSNMLGCFHQAIIFPVKKWRTLKLSEEAILFTMVEELCHAVWQVPDGSLIAEKVTEVFRQICPDFIYLDFVNKLNESL